MTWAVVNFIISVVGAAMNFYLLTEPYARPKPMFALIGVVLVIRAVMFWERMAAP